jgi:AcrR family transcriptional regulator
MNKKHLILKAALELFVNNGFSGTPTASIAKKAEVANGTLFHYFPTKERLINSLYMEVKDNFILSSTENYNPDDHYEKKIRELWHGIVKWALNEPLEYKFVQQYENSPYLNLLSAEERNRHSLFFKYLLEEGRKNNILRDLPVDMLMNICISQINGIIEFLIEHPESYNKNKDIIDKSFDCFWSGVGIETIKED